MTAWVLGLDGGGSKTALAYADASGRIAGPYLAPGINPFDQPDWAAGLTRLLRAHPAPGPLAHATLGLPGYGESPEVSSQQERLCRELLDSPVSVMNDVEAAFVGAFASEPGVLLLAGTGSMVWASSGGQQVRTGGWGEGFGDEGSAYWLGRQALSLASQALDGRHPDAAFAESLLKPLLATVDQPHLLDWYYRLTHVRSQVAALAERVDALAASGQPTACWLLQQGAAQLAVHVRAARTRLDRPDLPWSHAGSVLNSETVRSVLREQLGPPAAPKLPPLGGPLLHAARQAGFQTDGGWQANLAQGLRSSTVPG